VVDEFPTQDALTAADRCRSVLTNPLASDPPDIALAADAALSVRLLSALYNNDYTTNKVSQAALQILQQNKIDIDPATAKFVDPNAPPLLTTSEMSPKRSSSRKSRKGRRNTETEDVPIDSTNTSSKSNRSSRPNTAAAKVFGPPYLPTDMDKHSITMESILIHDSLGRDSVAAYIQWAIANIHCISSGCLGASIANTDDLAYFSEPGRPSIRPSDEFLIELRTRLQEIDSKLQLSLHANYTDTYFQLYGKEDLESMDSTKVEDLLDSTVFYEPFPHGHVEQHIVIVFLLLKLSAQLKMKQETNSHVFHFTRMSLFLLKRKPFHYIAKSYYALSFKFRMDMLEWNTDAVVFNSERDSVMWFFQKLLPLAKQYVQTTRTLDDVHLKKDALKKLINTYLAIHRDFLNNVSAASSVLTGTALTMDDLLQHNDQSIEYFEKEDVDWVKKFGKLRAQQCMQELKILSRQTIGK
jgi:hypothetical protein